ncbi:MAG: hypothetical protein AAB275_04170, partial [Deltaproteobacteria bacterium]
RQESLQVLKDQDRREKRREKNGRKEKVAYSFYILFSGHCRRAVPFLYSAPSKTITLMTGLKI